MNFAKKQLEKYGWKEGEGLGKEGNQGLCVAIKPKYKTGKEGMGFDFSKDLVDTWWTRAYSDSLSRIDVKSSQRDCHDDEEDLEDVTVSMPGFSNGDRVDEMTKMRKRMMRANFTEFSKGATLNKGLMQEENKTNSDSEVDSGVSTPTSKQLSDEDLFKACGGRTLHKAARFGHKLNGKLARIAAQEKAELLALQNSIQNTNTVPSQPTKKTKKKRKHQDSTMTEPLALEDEEQSRSNSSEKVVEKMEFGIKAETRSNTEEVIIKKVKKHKSKKKSFSESEPCVEL